VRLLLGFGYVLIVPGYALQAALFPREDDLDGVERVGLSLGLSVAVVPVLALILDRLPWGLRLWPIALSEVGATLIFAAIALWRRGRLPAGEAFVPKLTWRPRPWWRALPPTEKRVFTFTGAALLLAALSLVWVFAVPSPDEFFTEFYILGSEGLAENYPREVVAGQPVTITAGITNRERTDGRYGILAQVDDQVVGQAGPFDVPAGSSWEGDLTFTLPDPGDDQRVTFLLLREGSDFPYRELRLWLNVLPP
jgi:uncharacterized membrane protein